MMNSLAIIERDLHLQASARGNEVNLRGSAVATDQARRVLDALYARLDSGEDIQAGDVEGAIRQAIASDAQMILPTLEKNGKLAMAAISTAKKTIHARTPHSGCLYQGNGPGGDGFLEQARPAPGKPILLWPMPRLCWNGAPLTGSS